MIFQKSHFSFWQFCRYFQPLTCKFARCSPQCAASAMGWRSMGVQHLQPLAKWLWLHCKFGTQNGGLCCQSLHCLLRLMCSAVNVVHFPRLWRKCFWQPSCLGGHHSTDKLRKTGGPPVLHGTQAQGVVLQASSCHAPPRRGRRGLEDEEGQIYIT